MVPRDPLSLPPGRSRTAQLDCISQLPLQPAMATWLISSTQDVVEVMCATPTVLPFREAACPPHLLSRLKGGLGDSEPFLIKMIPQGEVEQREERNLHPQVTRWIKAAVLPAPRTAPDCSNFKWEKDECLSYLSHSYFHLCQSSWTNMSWPDQ